ncbi:uncharacterized protein LOC108458498 isoform X1 [Gossypium arboreum]|uniref:uncharacterized protein LOC108458498 isoform X1 n=1 Tax=Gossypium arboreum TaxID=29729 RepID=UPI0008196E4A|nr:uncharacterized protein LOC108458498 isoform X1 [Gossypium arboreum]
MSAPLDPFCKESLMGSEEAKDPLKGVDWKAIGSELQKDPSASNKPVVKKRLPKKIRQIPDCYFLPRMSMPSAIAFYGACIAGGIGAGMLLEVWINNKIKGIYMHTTYILCVYVCSFFHLEQVR